MAGARRAEGEAAFAEVVARQRERLVGSAYLVTGDATQAETMVQYALASGYAAGPSGDELLIGAYRYLMQANPARADLPWRRGQRFELIDGLPPGLPRGIVADLATLPPVLRKALVLEQYAQLPAVSITAVLDTDLDSQHRAAAEARDALRRVDPRRESDGYLSQELKAAVPPPVDLSPADLEHGRMLRRRRQLRRGLGAAVAALLAAVAGVAAFQLVPDARPAATATTAPSTPGRCDVQQPPCRVAVTQDWRARVAAVGEKYLDPKATYFSGYSYRYTSAYDSEAFWRGQGGALALDLFSVREGASQVFIQVASAPRFAVRCGAQTHHRCVSQRFMDGNVFAVTETTSMPEGMEVQYSPDGRRVVTVVARDAFQGPELPIERGDLIRLVQDPALTLPVV